MSGARKRVAARARGAWVLRRGQTAVGALLLCAAFATGCGPADRAAEAPADGSLDSVNRRTGAPVVLISIDTLRSDRLPAYGYRGGETPNIDRLAAQGVVFEHAFSHSPLTLPSHASVMTGVLPYEHGVRNNLGYRFEAGSRATLPEQLGDAGYATGAAVSSYVLRAATGIATGFDFYDDGITVRERQPLGRLERPGAASLAAADSWLKARAGESFLFWLHLFEPHAPYVTHSADSDAHPYDQEITAADAVVGQLIETLESLGVYEEALVVLFSDHGEGLGDHGESEHGIFLYRETIQVPLIVKLPGGQLSGRRLGEPVQLVDIMPTVLDVVGLPIPGGLSGRAIDWRGTGPARPIYAETLYPRIHLGWSELRSLVEFPLQLIDAPRPELYDLAHDPQSKSDLLAGEVEGATRRGFRDLQAQLEQHRAAEESFSAALGATAVSQEERRRLEALGYLGSGTSRPTGADPKDRIGELETLRRAFALETAGDLSSAASVLEELLDESPEWLDARTKLAQIYRDLGFPRRSLAQRKRAISQEPKLAAVQLLEIGALYLELGQLEDAQRHAEAASELEPGPASLLLAKVALRRGDLQRARDLAEPLVDRAATYYGAVLVVGECLSLGGDPAAALDLVERAVARAAERDEGPVEALALLRGDALARLGRNDEARQAFETEIDSFPRRLESYSRLAVLLAVDGRNQESRRTLARMVESVGSPLAFATAARTAEALGLQQDAQKWRARAGRGD